MTARSETGRKWPGPIPLGLVGMLALVAAVERGLAARESDYSTLWASAWRLAGKESRRPPAGRDVLAFGDSLIKEGLLPRVVEGATGRSTSNLAVFKGQAPASYFLLRRMLDAGARPSAILVDGELLEEDPLDLTRLWPELIDLREASELASTARDADFLAAVAAARALPSVRARYEVREAIVAAFKGQIPASRDELYPALRNWRANAGTHVQPTRPANPAIPAWLAATNYLPTTFRCHPRNARYVRRFLALAESRGVPVYWLMPPLHPEVQARRERGGLDGQFRRFLADLQARYSGLVVVDGRNSGYDPSTLFDLTHLNGRGAVAFSLAVADLLGPKGTPPPSPAGRWITLPPFREPRPGPAVEDVDQSRVALAARPRR